MAHADELPSWATLQCVKQHGNALFKQGDFVGSVAIYTEALAIAEADRWAGSPSATALAHSSAALQPVNGASSGNDATLRDTAPLGNTGTGTNVSKEEEEDDEVTLPPPPLAARLVERCALLTNRAAAYMRLAPPQPQLALLDAERAIALQPRLVKAYFRKALALHALGEPLRAECAAAVALALDPSALRRDAAFGAHFGALLTHPRAFELLEAQNTRAPDSFDGHTPLDRALRAARPGTTLVLAPGCHEVSLGELRVPLRIVGLGAGTPEQRAIVRHRSRLMVRARVVFVLLLAVLNFFLLSTRLHSGESASRH
jgi:tetratricopeptide (TPR) repeat protein